VGSGQLRITQVRSGSGKPHRMKRTLEALGLRHHQDVVVHADHPALRGMLQQVRHLVEVTSAAASEGEVKKPRRKKADAKS
jgi:large subunit ribosomal protein L30